MGVINLPSQPARYDSSCRDEHADRRHDNMESGPLEPGRGREEGTLFILYSPGPTTTHDERRKGPMVLGAAFD